uniref:Secreted protein n=1 Tax=Globodera pallida TaxID=36090 RepID=A0A183BQ40_GLOPA
MNLRGILLFYFTVEFSLSAVTSREWENALSVVNSRSRRYIALPIIADQTAQRDGHVDLQNNNEQLMMMRHKNTDENEEEKAEEEANIGETANSVEMREMRLKTNRE